MQSLSDSTQLCHYATPIQHNAILPAIPCIVVFMQLNAMLTAPTQCKAITLWLDVLLSCIVTHALHCIALHVKGLISGIKDENTTYTVCSIVSAATVIHQLCTVQTPAGRRLEALRKYLYHIDSMYCFVTLLPDRMFSNLLSVHITRLLTKFLTELNLSY